MYLNEPDKIEQGISELEKTVQVPEGIDKKEFLHRTFIYNEVNKTSGLVIYPHPYWNIEHRWHVGYKAALQILKNGLCDAFEIMGGGTPAENNMQAVMYDELLAEGKRLPLVASTDCHAVMESTMFCAASTIIFDDSNNITEAVKRGDCIAVEHPANETSRLYGPYRLARYASFLIDNYFPVHNRLCQSSGQVMTDYVLGDTKLFDLLEALEKRVVDFEAKFFGR